MEEPPAPMATDPAAEPMIGPAVPPPAAAGDAAEPAGLRWELLEEGTSAPELIEKKMPVQEAPVESTHFIKLRLHNLSSANNVHRIETPEFPFMGRTWRFLFFPRGNNTTDGSMSLYLDHVAPKEDISWGLCLNFVLTVHSEDEALTTIAARESRHRYTMTEADWGFPTMLKRNLFFSDEPGKRFIIDNAMDISVYVQVMKDEFGTLWNNFANYDSKKMTGYVGLRNQGATCYMNSILQSLYFTNSFRKAVYQIPVGVEDEKEKPVTYALQRVFYQLQTGNEPVGTTELTKSFGWDVVDSFMQHDVQEFNRVLCDNLENKMKDTAVKGTVAKLLEGQYKMYIRCINVDYESSRLETFYDIQLNVKGLKTLEDSFKDYIQVETMDGENKYMAEGFGLQDARKGVIFERLPPVLHLQLKRFEYDFNRDANVKINDRHEFPISIDLRQYMSNPDQQPPQVYHLHGVLVHSGDSHGGHYCAFIRPQPGGNWFKFDDDRVTRCSQKEAMDDNFGVELPDPNAEPKLDAPRTRMSRKFTNAYMLVYVRETEINEVLCPVTIDDVPQAFLERMEREREEQLRILRDREEEHLLMDVRVVLQEHFRANTGLDLYVRKPLDVPASGYLWRLHKSMTLHELRGHVEQTLKIPKLAQRYWALVQRKNITMRPDYPLIGHEDMGLDDIRLQLKSKGPLCLFLELPTVPLQELATVSPDKYFEPITADRHLIFIKYYEPGTGPVPDAYTYVGAVYVRGGERPLDIVDRVIELLGLAPKTPLKIWEEISAQQVEEIRPKKTFTEAEIGTGDILVFQKELSADATKALPHPTFKSYVEYITNRQLVKFRPRDNPRDPNNVFELTLSIKMTYDEVARLVGEHLKTDPMKLRFYNHRVQPEGPYNDIKRTPGLLLESMLVPAAQHANLTDTLYYEKLDISIVELENKLSRVVSWLNAHRQEEGPFTLLVEKTDLVSALFDQIKTKVSLRGDPNKKLKTDAVATPPAVSAVATPPTVPAVAPATVAPAPAPAPAVAEMDGVTPQAHHGHADDAPMSEDDHSPHPTATTTLTTTTTTAAAPMEDDAEAIEEGTGLFRLYQVYSGKVQAVFDGSKPVAGLAAYDSYIAEEIPADQLNIDPKDRLVLVVHFHRDVYSFHSWPFYFRIKHGETVGALKSRLRRIMGLPEKEFTKYKLAHLVRAEKAEYLTEDDAVVLDREWTERDFLGLDHVDKSARGGRFGQFERAVVIKN